jgi:hypothetical protein
MFEKAVRLKLRFDSPKGLLTVEDLWDLPLNSARGTSASLQAIGQDLTDELKDNEANTFVINDSSIGTTKKTNEIAQLKLEIVKHIAGVRVAENTVAAQAAARKEQKQKILGILAQKKDEKLLNSSAEDLEKLLETL